MSSISESEFDKLVSHLIRIELKNGSVLKYMVTPEAKAAFKKLLRDDAQSVADLPFVWFYIIYDRLVMVKTNEIVRITFCFDPSFETALEYYDNFNMRPQKRELLDTVGTPYVISDEDDDIDLPQLIIMHSRQLEDTEVVKGVTIKT